jgi:hypothetical protein
VWGVCERDEDSGPRAGRIDDPPGNLGVFP